MLRWLLWCGFVLCWTIALEMPYPGQEETPGGEEVVLTKRKIVGKTLHILVYAAMSASAPFLPLAQRYRFVLVFILIGHAWLTEQLQDALGEYFHRGGSLGDVGLDMLGIALGIAVTWKWWTYEPRPSGIAP